MRNLDIEPIKMMISIVNRGEGKALIQLYDEQNVKQHMYLMGRGTATSEIMDLLGLDGLEKDIVFSYSKATVVNQLLYALKNDSQVSANAKGIVFDLPLTGMSNLATLAILAQVRNENGREDSMMDNSSEYSMIMVTVNQGFTEEVMATARKAGARGGTILHARWAGAQAVEQFYGITVQAEKEIILIVTPTEKRNDIMNAINDSHGLKTEARGAVCSLGIENVVKL